MMPNLIRRRSVSLSMVVLVLLVISLLQEGISYTTVFGSLDNFVPGFKHGLLPSAWLVFRGILVAVLFSFSSQAIQRAAA